MRQAPKTYRHVQSHTHLLTNLLLVLLLPLFPLHATAMLHSKPRLAINVGMDVIFVVGQFDVVPFRVIEWLAHGLGVCLVRGVGWGQLRTTLSFGKAR